MKSALLIRPAVFDDAELITKHRHRMFQDNNFAAEEALARMALAFTPWLRAQLEADRYVGLLAEQDGGVVAGAGIFFADFPPHWRHAEAVRGYILNVYTEPSHRGLGVARLLTRSLVAESHRRGVKTVVLHASPQGRPVYEALGFVASDEMIIGLDEQHLF